MSNAASQHRPRTQGMNQTCVESKLDLYILYSSTKTVCCSSSESVKNPKDNSVQQGDHQRAEKQASSSAENVGVESQSSRT